jgi:hypothetical protein
VAWVLLNGTFSLLGIQDVEAFTGGIVQRSGLHLSVEDREELHVFLIESAWELSRRYEQQPSGITFSSWAGHKLRLRVVDWQRSRFGRTRWTFAGRVHERKLPRLVPLDELDAALDEGASDPADGGDSAFGGLLDGGDRQRARDLDTLGLEAPRRATG